MKMNEYFEPSKKTRTFVDAIIGRRWTTIGCSCSVRRSEELHKYKIMESKRTSGVLEIPI